MRVVYLLFIVSLSGCQFTYLLKSGYHQALLIKDQVPIEEFIKKSNSPEEETTKLKLVQKVKDFSEGELGLKKSSNYTTYVKLDRPFVSYIVQVAEPFELKYRYWKFPIVGKLPYKGFFTEDDAKIESDKFAKKGYDTFVRGVRAYSTLGWFRDAVLSSMLKYEEDDLVNLIIHETVHTTLFIKNSADFNEQLATFIGNKGTELFYKKIEGEDSANLKRIRLKNEDEALFSDFISKEVKLLEDWYATNKGKIETAAKEKRLIEIQDRFKKIQFKTNSFAYFNNLKLNNAVLLGFKTYVNDLSTFEKIFDKHKSLASFVNTVKKLERSKNPNADLLTL